MNRMAVLKISFRRRQRAARRARPARGFTLLELIVAVGIMMIVAAVAAETISDAFKIKQSAEDAVESTRDTEIVGDIFVEELKNVPPPSTLSASTDPGAAAGSITVSATTIPYYFFGPFQGDNGTVTFYTTGLDRNSPVPGDVRYVEFGLSPDRGGGMNFVRRQRTNLLEDQISTPVEEVLVQNAISVEFEYWDGAQWQNTWDSTTNGNLLPFAVGMKLTLKPVKAGTPNRVIERFAIVPCAMPSTSTQAGGITGGLGQ